MIKFSNVQLGYGRMPVLNALNFEIKKGDFFRNSWSQWRRKDHSPEGHFRPLKTGKRRNQLSQ